MQSPFTGGEVRLISVTESVTFRGESFSLTTGAYLCVDSNEQFTTTAQDDAMMAQVRRLWCEQHNVPPPARLLTRRTEVGLSTPEVSSLLGMGINEYRQYEKGAKVPSKSNARLLTLFADPSPRILADLVTAAGPDLPAKALRKLQPQLAAAAALNRASASVYEPSELVVSHKGIRPKRARAESQPTTHATPATVPASLFFASDRRATNAELREIPAYADLFAS